MEIENTNNQISIPDILNKIELDMLKLDQVYCPVTHHFSPGLYIREVMFPKGAFVIGHMQKTTHLNIFLKGSVTVLNKNGTTTKLVAPMIFTGEPGRKCGYMHEDVVWLNIYPTHETDIEKLEEAFLDKTDQWKDSQVKEVKRRIDNMDYIEALNEINVSPETVESQSQNTDDLIDFPYGSYNVMVSDSAIDRRGLFATARFKAGDEIAPCKINGRRTPAGRYLNHSISPNAEIRFVGDDTYLYAASNIEGCRGGMTGEEITIDYRTVFDLKNNEVV